MGGYGASSGRIKEDFYYDTGGYKVKDDNAITVGEYYIKRGYYVAFLQENPPHKRADLSVEGVHVEVKGMTSTNTNKVANNIREAFEQIKGDDYKYPESLYQAERVVILSKYQTLREAYKIVYGGFRKAKSKGFIPDFGEVYLLHKNEMIKF